VAQPDGPADVQAGGTDGLEWRRPHPLTIVIEIGNAIRSLIVPVLVVRGGFLGVGNLIENVVIVIPLVAALARWYSTRYALGPESVFHQYGLLRRRKQVLPRANVQNVSTKAGIVARMGSVVELQISDASSSGDISLRLISRHEADRLTTLLRSSMPNRGPDPEELPGIHDDGRSSAPVGAPATPPHGVGVGGPTGPPVEPPPLVDPTLGELARVEATSLAVLAPILVGLSGAVVGALVVWRYADELPDPRFGLIMVGVLGLAPIVGTAVTMGSRLLALGGYQLFQDPDRLRIQAGLLTEARVAARRERLQQIQVIRDLTHQWMGLERVKYETADIELDLTLATSYLDPAGSHDGWRDLATEAIGEVEVDEADLHPVSPLTRRRTWIRFVLASPLGVAPLGLLHPLAAVGGIVAWLGLGWWYATRRHQVLGWITSPNQYLVRSGVLQQRLTLVRLDKIQSLRVTSTLFQRRLGLATVSVSTAGHGFIDLVSLPDLPEQAARHLHDELASRAARTPIARTL
jgi:putative membrane protein